MHYCWLPCNVSILLRMISKQTRMAARAPMLSLRICSSCMSSQLAPENPAVHAHLYLSVLSLFMQEPPLRQGLSRHSFRSSHPFPSGVTRCPRGHLNSESLTVRSKLPVAYCTLPIPYCQIKTPYLSLLDLNSQFFLTFQYLTVESKLPVPYCWI